MESQTIVTIGVVTYNSSKYILETLDSIKAQTYQPLNLIISDDCSNDNTIKICEQWIAENKSRFVETKIIMPEHNTGVSGNVNRAWDACETVWFKGIAGDDVLKPDCVEENVLYVSEHPDAVAVFSRVDIFGPSKERIDYYSGIFDYAFFELTPEKQYERLVVKGNCVPAPSLFLNINKIREMRVRADERIPLLDDYPLWINLLKRGVRFHFVDKVLIGYRTGEAGMTSGKSVNSRYLRSVRYFELYYRFPALYEKNPEDALGKLLSYEQNLIQDLESLQNSPSFRLGSLLLSPLKWFVDFWRNIKEVRK